MLLIIKDLNVMLVIGLSLLSLTFSCLSIFMQCYIPKKIHRLKKRNKEVYEFRKWVLNNRYDLYEKLPDYDTMFKDNRPIKLETYLSDKGHNDQNN